ncbi:MAG: AAA family ATPase [Elusimicrobiales bacterium]|nr:AAA family ATPase [Elusimicrobiales bacterium]
MIKRLEMVDYGKFKKDGLDLGPFTVITGPNEAGKTTIFDALFDALCAESRHEGHPLWKNLAGRYGALRKSALTWEEGAAPLSFGDNEFIEIFAIRGGELGVKHADNSGASSWALAAENALLNAGLNPEVLAAALADKAESGRKGSVKANIKRLREALKDHEQAIAGLKAERDAVLADASQAPRLEAEKKDKEAKLAAKTAELKAKEAALEKLSASARRAVVMAGITAVRELEEARSAAAAMAAFASDETTNLRSLQRALAEAEKSAAAAEAALAEKRLAVAAAAEASGELARRLEPLKLQSERADALAARLGAFASEPEKISRSVNANMRFGIFAGGAVLAAFVAYSGRSAAAYGAAALIMGAALWAGFKFSIVETLTGHTSAETRDLLSALEADWNTVSSDPFPTTDLEAARAFLAKIKAEYEAAVRSSGEKSAESGVLAVLAGEAEKVSAELGKTAQQAQGAIEAWLKARGCLSEEDYQNKVAEFNKRSARAADREQRVLALAGGSGCANESEFKDKLFAENGDLERRGVIPAQGADAELARLKHEAAALSAEARDIEAALNKVNSALETNKAVSGARLGGLPERLNQVETVLELDKTELAELELQAEAYTLASGIFKKLAESSAIAFEALGKEVTGTLRAILPEAHAEFRGFEAAGAAVTDASGITRPVKSLSSGTRDLFMLAARLTIAHRARLGPEGLAPALLVLDEPFYTMDAERERLALKLLGAFHRNTGWQIIILTKDAALAPAAKTEGLPVTEVALTSLS